MKKNNSEEKLFEIAKLQGGYFSAMQANQAGIGDNNHLYHVKAGNWIREWRGIYRLALYPIQEDAQYSLWGMWSCNRKGVMQGTYSHETALALYNLSDMMPNKLHMTVPRGYRRHGVIPQVLRLHYAPVEPAECEERNGYQVTKPFKTIIDIVNEQSVSPEFVKQAVQVAVDKGYLAKAQYTQLMNMPRIGKRLKNIMGNYEA
jgi:predicted transcriptional regulator of viral defense system